MGKKERRGPASLFLLDPQVSGDDRSASGQGCIIAQPCIRRKSRTVFPFAWKIVATDGSWLFIKNIGYSGGTDKTSSLTLGSRGEDIFSRYGNLGF